MGVINFISNQVSRPFRRRAEDSDAEVDSESFVPEPQIEPIKKGGEATAFDMGPGAKPGLFCWGQRACRCEVEREIDHVLARVYDGS